MSSSSRPAGRSRGRSVAGSLTALVLAAGLAGAAGLAPAQAAGPLAGTLTAQASRAAAVSSDTARTDRALSAPASRSASLRASGPIGFRTATLTTHPSEPTTAEPSQQVVRAVVKQDKAPATISAAITLGAAPTAATVSKLVVAFGNVSPDGMTCESPQGSNIIFDSAGTSQPPVLTYDGARVTVSDLRLSSARTASWDCAFVQTISSDQTTRYDSVIGNLTDHVDKPHLGFSVRGKKLQPRGFTPVVVKIRNAGDTVAPARNGRLTWKTRGVVVRGDHRVPTIAPGSARNVRILVKSTARTGKVTLTMKASGATERITLRVTRTRA